MEDIQEKSGESARRPSGARKKQNGKQIKSRQPTGEEGDNKNNAMFHRKNRESENAGKEGPPPEPDEPVSFNAHALDLEPGQIIPQRPSIDLTYNDFTRESYEAGERPFVPRKKKIVPFELSETPRTQSENQRLKKGASADNGGDKPSANHRQEEQTRAQDKAGREEQNPMKSGAKRQDASRAKTNTRRQDQAPARNGAKRQERPRARQTGDEGSNDAGGQPLREPDRAPSGDQSKESLMKPYWMKNK